MANDIVKRLEAHMGRAEVPDLLCDCREAAAEITRLREALSKEAAAREEAERERDAAVGKRKVWNYYTCRVLKHHRGRIADLTSKLEATAGVLKPFAEAGAALAPSVSDSVPVFHLPADGRMRGTMSTLTMAHFRRAREAHAALLGKEKGL